MRNRRRSNGDELRDLLRIGIITASITILSGAYLAAAIA